jgi:hypothetical protein
MRSRMERQGEKGSEEDDYFNKFSPTMPSLSASQVKIAVKTYALHFRHLLENH